jgi:hypothetical protein
MWALLRGFNLEIKLAELQCLLLPLRRLMGCLNSVKQYIQSRCNNAIKDALSVYQEFRPNLVYAVRYFDCDPSHAHEYLQDEIKRIMTTKSGAECKELADRQIEYNNLKQKHADSTCDFEQVEQRVDGEPIVPEHNKKCA